MREGSGKEWVHRPDRSAAIAIRPEASGAPRAASPVNVTGGGARQRSGETAIHASEPGRCSRARPGRCCFRNWWRRRTAPMPPMSVVRPDRRFPRPRFRRHPSRSAPPMPRTPPSTSNLADNIGDASSVPDASPEFRAEMGALLPHYAARIAAASRPVAGRRGPAGIDGALAGGDREAACREAGQPGAAPPPKADDPKPP